MEHTWPDDLIECIARCLCENDTRSAVALLTSCSAYRKMLPHVGIAFLHLRRFGAAGIRLPLQRRWDLHLNAQQTGYDMSYHYRGCADFPPTCKVCLPDDVVFQKSLAARAIMSRLVSDRLPHNSTLFATLYGAGVAEWEGAGCFNSFFFDTNHTTEQMKAVMQSRNRERQRMDNIILMTHLPCGNGRVARFMWNLSFSYRHYREVPSGPRDNNDFYDYVELSSISINHASLLVTSPQQQQQPPVAPPL